MPQRLFIFIQLEFPWALGPADGRYLLRSGADSEPERVIVLGTLEPTRPGAAGRGSPLKGPSLLERLGAGGPGRATTPDPAPASTTRVTVIDPVPLSAESQARAWLAELDRERDVRAAVAIVNRVLQFHRVASADPYLHEISPEQALVIRAGWGEGEQVASGMWLHARQLPWRPNQRSSPGPRPGGSRARSSVLRPQERLAALLGAKGRALMCEELALRARLDLDQRRPAHAVLELENALAIAVGELRGEGRQDLAIRIAELEQLSDGVIEQARTVRSDESAVPDEEVIAHALGRLEAALRARTAGGFG
jgi:hypothetical protein